MESSSSLLTSLAVQLEATAATLPWPTLAADGVSIAGWKRVGQYPRRVAALIENVDNAEVTIEDLEVAVHYGSGATDWATAGLVTVDAIILPVGRSVFLWLPDDVVALALADRIDLAATVTGTTPQLRITLYPAEIVGPAA